MSDERGQQYKRSYVAAAVASVSTVVAAVVGYLTNVLTSSWGWTLFAALAALVTVTAVLPFVAEKIEGQRQRQAEEFRLRAEGQAVIARRDRERMAALHSHFQSRAQGLTPSWSRREWYFTGRERVLSEIVDWIAAGDVNVRARIITGGPGSGKSAVLGRFAGALQRAGSTWATCTVRDALRSADNPCTRPCAVASRLVAPGVAAVQAETRCARSLPPTI